ncbi:integrase [Kitasatospora cineracea]|uniref:integrase n=1 Tax=Kitasatospora cineracea TaxID=88074 RepID=UPI0036DBAD0D
MTTSPLAALPGRSALFRDDEPVIQSHPLLPDVPIPVFGDSQLWSFDAVRRPANIGRHIWAVGFQRLSAVWNLRAREVAMCLLNPRHPVLEAAGVSLDRDPYQPTTLTGMVSELRVMAAWAKETGRGEDIARWTGEDMRAFIQHLALERSKATVRNYVIAIRTLHELGPVLTGGGLAADPWPGRTARSVADDRPREELSTKNIAPRIWFPLVKAAWTYIDVFGPDILRARDTQRRLKEEGSCTSQGFQPALRRWLADPGNRVPLHHGGRWHDEGPNWELFTLQLGWAGNIRPFHSTRDRDLREQVQQAVAEGRCRPGSFIEDIATVTRPDGSVGPWRVGLDARAVIDECLALRTACYVFVAALSMMRDSEIREITRGSVVEHYGAPAVVSRKRKLDPGRPLEHWWITEPVARAIVTAEELSRHCELVFADPGIPGSTEEKSYAFSPSRDWIKRFIRHVNDRREQTGLPEIPSGKANPHMFRKTMAMLVGTEPGSEIALGIQLKHAATRALANRSTQGYAGTDTAWAEHLGTAIDDARFQRLKDLYDRHHDGETIGFGPGADRLTATFDAVKKAARGQPGRAAVNGDKRTEYDLLRKTRVSLRYGKLNHCTVDDNDPSGAKCLEEAIVPDGHKGPLIDRCQPGRCPNSVITPEHLNIWRSEEASLLALLDTPKIAPCRRDQLHQQLDEVRSVIRRAAP